jgi:hypothetical protein
MLLLELIETLEEPRPLPAGNRDLGRFEELAQFGSRRVDDRGRQHSVGDLGQDVGLDEIGGAATRAAAEGGAAVVTTLGATLEVGLAAHAGAACTLEPTAEQVVTERLRLVPEPRPCGDRGHRPVVLGQSQDWLVPAWPLVATALLDNVAGKRDRVARRP